MKTVNLKELIWNGIKTTDICLYEVEVFPDGASSIGVFYQGTIENLKLALLYRTRELDYDQYIVSWVQENKYPGFNCTDVYIQKRGK